MHLKTAKIAVFGPKSPQNIVCENYPSQIVDYGRGFRFLEDSCKEPFERLFAEFSSEYKKEPMRLKVSKVLNFLMPRQSYLVRDRYYYRSLSQD